MRHFTFALVVFASISILIGGLVSQTHGVTRTFLTDQNRVSQTNPNWGQLYLDGASIATFHLERNPTHVKFSGYIAYSTSIDTIWRIYHTGGITVKLDEQTVLDFDDYHSDTYSDIEVKSTEQFLQIEVIYQLSQPLEDKQVSFAIYEQTPLGWQLIPSHRLYNAPPDSATVHQEETIYNFTSIALLFILTSIISLLVYQAYLMKLWRNRTFLWVVSLTLIALLIRVIVVYDRSATDILFSFLPPGTDNYIMMARETLNGNSFISNAYYNPGMIFWFVLLNKILGPHLVNFYILHIVIGSISVGIVSLTGIRVWGYKVGIIAGFLAAIYPPLVFFQTTLQIEALLVSVIPFVMYFGLYAIRQHTWQMSLAFGIAVGLSGLLRANMLVLVLALPITLLMTKQWQQAFQLTVIAGLGVFMILTPQMLANFTNGSSSIVSSNGGVNLYVGNNRDGDGTSITHKSQAWSIVNQTDRDFTQAFFDDLNADPLRIFTLQLHKVGLFWQANEIPNNVDFYTQGVDRSILLRIPFTMPVLAILAITGLLYSFINLRDLRKETLFTSLLILIYMGVTVMFFVISRLRIGVVPFLFIPASITIIHLFSRPRFSHQRRNLSVTFLISVIIVTGMLLIGQVTPIKRFWHQEIADMAITVNHDFDEVRLLGYTPINISPEQGNVHLAIVWQLLDKTSNDHIMYLHLTNPQGERIAGNDVTLGGITYPVTPTSSWQTGDKFIEDYFIKIPEQHSDIIGISVGLYGYSSVEFFNIGFYSENYQQNAFPVATSPVEYLFEDSLYLTDIAISEPNSSQLTLDIYTNWLLKQPLYENWFLFFHVLNEQGELVSQSDGKYLRDGYTTSALIPEIAFTSYRQIQLPEDIPPGTYTLYAGFYRLPSVDRVQVTDANNLALPNNVIQIGSFELER